MKKIITLLMITFSLCIHAQTFEWVFLPQGTQPNGSCASETKCGTNILSFGLKYTPSYTGTLTSYTAKFKTTCANRTGVFKKINSCVMRDNSTFTDYCSKANLVIFDVSGNDGRVKVKKGEPIIIHQINLEIPQGESITIDRVEGNSFTTSITLENGESENERWDTFTASIKNRDNLCPACEVAPTLDTDNNIFTKAGISTLDRKVDDTWVTESKSGFLKLESKTLGFVPTRVTTTERNALTAEEGMVIWNTTTNCLEYYNGTEWVCSQPKCKKNNS